MRFVTFTGEEISFDGEVRGDPDLVAAIHRYIEAGEPSGCDYWGQIDPSLDTPWEAYLSICGALTAITGDAPVVHDVPANPDGYEPEGPREGLTDPSAEDDNPDYDWTPVHDEVTTLIAKYS